MLFVCQASALSMDTLQTYRKKRDFGKTPEPAGGTARRSTRSRRTGGAYVIQKHAARALHYDFRLELDGVLQELGGTERARSRTRRETPRRSGRGSPARIRRLRRRHPQRRIRRRHRHAVGSRPVARGRWRRTSTPASSNSCSTATSSKAPGRWCGWAARRTPTARTGFSSSATTQPRASCRRRT